MNSVKVKLRKQLRAVAVAAMVLFAAATAGFSQDRAPAATAFRIGYLSQDPEAPLSSNVMFKLRDFLLNRADLREAMEAENMKGIDVLSSDSHQDLTQRMSLNHFDLVFCSSVDYVSQSGAYEPLFQLRRPGDRFTPSGDRVFHYGEIFVSRKSELFPPAAVRKADLSAYFSTHEIAVSGSYSAAGYIYPQLKIADLTSASVSWKPVFCASPEEVVKCVINGIAEIGACDSGVIEEVLASNGLSQYHDELVRVLWQTDPIPTDPVAVLPKWLPRRSRLGDVLAEALPLFFSAPLPGLENSSRDKYADLRMNLATFKTGPR